MRISGASRPITPPKAPKAAPDRKTGAGPHAATAAPKSGYTMGARPKPVRLITEVTRPR